MPCEMTVIEKSKLLAVGIKKNDKFDEEENIFNVMLELALLVIKDVQRVSYIKTAHCENAKGR